MEKKKEVEIGNPVTIAGVTLIPVTKSLLSYRHGKYGVSFFGVRQPIGVVVISPSGKRAFSISGEEVLLDELIPEASDIKELLAGI